MVAVPTAAPTSAPPAAPATVLVVFPPINWPATAPVPAPTNAPLNPRWFCWVAQPATSMVVNAAKKTLQDMACSIANMGADFLRLSESCRLRCYLLALAFPPPVRLAQVIDALVETCSLLDLTSTD